MGAALYIALEHPIPDFDPFVNGKALSKTSGQLDAIATELGVRPLMEFFSADPEMAAEFLPEGVEAPPRVWFTAAAGLVTVRARHGARPHHRLRARSPLVSPGGFLMPPLRFILLMGWLISAVLLGASGALADLRPPFPQIILLALVAVLLIAHRVSRPFHRWISSVPIRWLISVHLIRFVGFYFLYLHHLHQLPFAFAVPGGCGDILVAVGALLLLLTRRTSGRLVLAWNVLGLADILFVVLTAARLAFHDPASMDALLRFPLSLLPTFIVPIIIFTHIILFLRLPNRAELEEPETP
jgi:hypothetical protein